jgi:hypothetical protein
MITTITIPWNCFIFFINGGQLISVKLRPKGRTFDYFLATTFVASKNFKFFESFTGIILFYFKISNGFFVKSEIQWNYSCVPHISSILW